MTYEEKIAAAQAKMEAIKEKMAAAADKAKAARAMKKEEIAAAIAEINSDLDELDAIFEEDLLDFDQTVAGDVVAAKENLKMAKDRKDSKINALKLKAQMRAEVLKEKIADKREARDKAAQEAYILDLLDYAQSCQQIAFAAAVEADLTLLEAAEVAADYVNKYGEPEATAD